MRYAIALTFLLMMAAAWCQDADITVNMDTSAASYGVFFPSYLDSSNPAAQPYLFRLTLTNHTPAVIPNTDYQLKITITWNDSYILNEKQLAPKAGNDLQPNVPKTFTNNQIVNDSSPYFSWNVSFNDVMDAIPDLKDYILNTGRFPDGLYLFTINVEHTTNGSTSESTGTLRVVSPAAIVLVYPGSPAGSMVRDYFTQFPSFVWTGNLISGGGITTPYDFKLFEIDRPNLSAEEIEQLPVYYHQTSTTTILSYPAGAPPLTVGKLYAWQVSGVYTTPVGVQTMRSPVFVFRVSSSSDPQIYGMILDQLLTNLHVEGMESVLQLLNDGYTPSGAAMFMGQKIPLESVYDIIGRIGRGELVPVRVIVE
jgi:hypothetical protein